MGDGDGLSIVVLNFLHFIPSNSKINILIFFKVSTAVVVHIVVIV